MKTWLAVGVSVLCVFGFAQAEIVVCHAPPGNPENTQTITVGSQSAADAHLRHGDTLGPCDDGERHIAVLYVGHGEPATAEAGDVSITFPDGELFGPHAVELGVPPGSQYTEWAAAYEEIATAMAYIFGDTNGNGVPHEVALVPEGDVPGFFNWPAFHAGVYQNYEACYNYSPHNDSIREHVESLEIELCDTDADVYLAFLDAVPRVRDVLYDLAMMDRYDELVVVPMLVSDSTHTQEVDALIEESAHLTEGMEIVITEPFFEVPYMRHRLRDAALAMAKQLRRAIPDDVADHNIGVLLASHGTPYVPPFPEFGWQEGDIYSNLIPTEDAFHHEIGERLPWASKTGRMKYSSPTVEDGLAEFDAEGFTHVIVIPSAFPTAAIHTMVDVGGAAIGRTVLPQEGIVEHTRPSGVKVYYSASGLADFEPGGSEYRAGLAYLGRAGVMQALDQDGSDDDFVPFVPCPAGELCVTVTAEQLTGSGLQFLLYDTAGDAWPQDFTTLPIPDWVVIDPPPMPDRFPARLRIPIENNLLAIEGGTLEGAELGLVVASADGTVVEPGDARGYSGATIVHHEGQGMDFGSVVVAVPQEGGLCLPGEICVTVTAQATTGPDLKLMLYETDEDGWPQNFRTLPTPGWVITETVPVPGTFPIHIRIPMAPNLFAISTEPIEGARLGLAVVTGVASTFIVEPTDARGFSEGTLVYQPGAVMHFGDVDLDVPQGEACDLNPFHPTCLTGALLWDEHYLGEPGFVPGAIYIDVADIDGDGTNDIVMVGEPHFENPDLPLDVLKLGVYYLEPDFSVRATEIIDAWTDSDPLFYSPWGVRVIEHAGAPMILVGTNIPGLAPLEDGTGAVLSYRHDGNGWVRSVVMENPDPTVTNYNAMIVVTSDIDQDGDQDLALSGAFGSSSVGNWMENTGLVDDPWIPHLQPMAPGTDPYIRGTLGYKSADLNGDGYPEVVYNAMFDIANTDPPRYRGEIWLAINPGPAGWDDPWQKVVIDDDNWASADMWFHDLDDDGDLDLVANQIFNSTVTVYRNPGGDLAATWDPVVIISGLTSPSDMWLADMDGDGLMDVVSADHTAHRGVWHRNPGPDLGELWESTLIYRNIRLPGDFAMIDVDEDGDLDWVGTSLTLGQAFIVEQVRPDTSLITTVSLPDGFQGDIKQLVLTLATEVPVTGMPAAILATIDNVDADGDGLADVDQILNGSRDLVLALGDVGVTGDYHVVAALYMEGGGVFQPLPGIDYMAASDRRTFGQGQVEVTLDLELIPSTAAGATDPALPAPRHRSGRRMQ